MYDKRKTQESVLFTRSAYQGLRKPTTVKRVNQDTCVDCIITTPCTTLLRVAHRAGIYKPHRHLPFISFLTVISKVPKF